MGQGQEKEELDSLTGPSTSVLWKDMTLKAAEGAWGGQKSNPGSWEEHRPGSNSVFLGNAPDPFESRFPRVCRGAAPTFGEGVKSEGEEVSQRLRDLGSWACICCCPSPHGGFLSTWALCRWPCVLDLVSITLVPPGLGHREIVH